MDHIGMNASITPNPRYGRRAVLGFMLATAAAGLAACSTESSNLANQNKEGSGKGYVAGDGSVSEYAPEDRGEPVEFTGETFSGTKIDAASYAAGDVLVLNFWYAACSPCRVEAPALKAVADEFKDKGVTFLGVNVRDEKAAAEAFDKTFKLPYESVRDLEGGVLLALSQYVPPQAVPTTLVLDPNRRVSARVLGVVEESTLRALIKTAQETPADAK